MLNLPDNMFKCEICGVESEGEGCINPACKDFAQDLTADILDDLSDDVCRLILHNKALEYYGTERYKTKLAGEVGMSLDGLNNWFRRGGRPSAAVIMYLHVKLELREANETLTNLGKALKGLKGYLPD